MISSKCRHDDESKIMRFDIVLLLNESVSHLRAASISCSLVMGDVTPYLSFNNLSYKAHRELAKNPDVQLDAGS
jgi:hypothetical protein